MDEKKKRKIHYRANRLSYIERAKAWYGEHIEHRSTYMKDYTEKNRTAHNAGSKKNAATHVEYYRTYHRERAQAIKGDLTKQEWYDILEQYNYKCAYCLKGHNKLQADHIIPHVKGGRLTKDNVVPACPTCNKKKHTKSILSFIGAY